MDLTNTMEKKHRLGLIITTTTTTVTAAETTLKLIKYVSLIAR